MSRPIRYGLADEHLGRIFPKEDGHLVMHSDYAALQAQLERLKKAGDAFLGVYIHACAKGLVDEDTAHEVVGEWRDAKEGRAAK